jgi:glycosyl transferase family 25
MTLEKGGVEQPGWPIYVISLARATERRARCRAAMEQLGLGFEFFDAVEGARLTGDEIARVYDGTRNQRVYKHPLTAPEMGCTLSHVALWRRIAAGEAGGAFILEDDFEAVPELAELMRAISAGIQENCMTKLFARRPSRGVEIGALGSGYKLVMPRHVPGQTVGYAVDRVAAGKLAARALPMARPIDMEIKHWWQFDVPVLVVEPSPLSVSPQTGSGIEAARLKEKQSGLKRVWRNLRYQAAYNFGVWRNGSRERAHARRLRESWQGR